MAHAIAGDAASTTGVLEGAPGAQQRVSKVQRRTGRILTGLVSAFFLLDGVMKLFKPEEVVKGTVELGYPEASIVGIGLTLVVCTILYLIPRTAFLGAVLLTGYLGGAVATHVRVGQIGNVPFPVIFGAVVWAGLWLRSSQARRAAWF